MKNQFFAILLLSITVLGQEAQSGPDQIIELFRHGARSPGFDLDPSWSDKGKLTPVGFRQHHILGKALAKKYPNLINNAYRDNRIYLLSSNVTRCVESAGAHLHGLYSEIAQKKITLRDDYPRELAIPGFEDPFVEEMANSLPNNEVIPFNFLPGAYNVADAAEMFIFAGGQYCPSFVDWYNENRQDSFTKESFKNFEDTVDNINKLLPKNLWIKTPSDLHIFADAMLADIFDNRTLVGQINDPVLITNITWAYTLFFYHFGLSQQVQRELSSFHLIEALLEQLENFRRGESYSTAAFFSGHDDNLVSLLSAFGIINDQCILENFHNVLKTGEILHPNCQFPSFASDIIIEFYNKTETPYVKILYKNRPVNICNGKFECPYEEFVIFARNAAGNNTRETYFKRCGGTVPDYMLVETSGDSRKIQTVLNIVLVIVCLSLVYKLFYDRRRYIKLADTPTEKQIAYEEQQQEATQESIYEI